MTLIRQWIQSATIALVSETRALLVTLGGTTDHRDKRFLGQQTGAVVWQPTAGKALRITGITLAGDDPANVTLFQDVDAEGNRLVDLPSDASIRGVDKAFVRPLELAVNKALKLTTNIAAGKQTRVVVFGFEE